MTPELEKKIDDLIDTLRASMGSGRFAPIGQAGDLKSLVENANKFKQTIAESNTQFQRWQRALTGTAPKFVVIGDQLQELDKQFNELAENAKKSGQALTDQERKSYQSARAELKKTQAIGNVQTGLELLGGTIQSVAASLITNTLSTAGQFVKNLQTNQSAFAVSSSLMTGIVNTVSSAGSAIGGALAGVGTGLMAFGGRVKWAGLALTGLGSIIGGVSAGLGKLLKFGIEILSTEVEQTIEAFSASSSAGALFSDGMTGLRNAANGAGLTVTQFSKVISENSEQLARSGVGVTEAARIVGRVGEIMRKSGTTDQLLKLGYSFEEQASLTAEVMADMRRLGARASDRELAESVSETARNFRLLSAITGEDARKKTEQMRQQNNILAFQLKVAQASPQQQQALNAAMSSMTDMEARAFRDLVVFGTIRDKEAAIQAAQVEGFRERAQAQADAFRANELTADRVLSIQTQYGQAIGDSVKKQEALAQATMATGKYSGVSAAMLQDLYKSGIITKEAFDAAKAGVDGQKVANDALTSSVVGAAKAVQDFRVALQELLLPYMASFAQITEAMLSQIRKLAEESGIKLPAAPATTNTNKAGTPTKESSIIDYIPGIGGIEKSRSGLEAGTRGALGALGVLGGGLLGGFLGKSIGSAGVGAAGGGYLAEKLSDLLFGKLPERAYGGEVNPYKPYLVGERGPELFKPDIAGQIIPNQQLMSGANAGDIKMLLKEQLQLQRQNASLSNEIKDLLSDIKNQDNRYYSSAVG